MQVHELTRPATGLSLVDIAEPPTDHRLSPGQGVTIDVRSASVGLP
jgi:hypothetical protein